MTFPYGNDLNHPDLWAGYSTTKAENYMVGYHSGASLFLGAHTFLFFGMESLCAFSATLIGGGPSLTYGLSKAAKRVPREGGQSNRYATGMDVSKPLERIEKGKDVVDAYDWSTSLDNINSAHQIYKILAGNVSTFKALVPFSAEDLAGTLGVVSGVKADVLIGGAGYYLADARDLFTEVTAFNLSSQFTLVSASLGTLVGIWKLDKFFNLWGEISYSKQDEYPFQAYNVHPFFKQWKSKAFAYELEASRLQEQDKIINQITQDMINNPKKYGYPDSDYALQRVVERTQQFYDGGRSLESNSFLPWISADQRELFGAPRYGGLR